MVNEGKIKLFIYQREVIGSAGNGEGVIEDLIAIVYKAGEITEANKKGGSGGEVVKVLMAGEEVGVG